MTTTQMAQLICTSVLFITVILAGVFSVEVAGVWLRNRREERRNGIREAERTVSERFDRERNSWMELLAQKDRELEITNALLARLQKNYDIATKVLAVADRKEDA